jgi:hypothetical protein
MDSSVEYRVADKTSGIKIMKVTAIIAKYFR